MIIKIKELRKKRLLSQQELATALNVSRQTVSYIENGHKQPTITLALKIAKFFNLSVEELFSLEENDIKK